MTHAINWNTFLSLEKKLPYFQNILDTLIQRKKLGAIIYPKQKDIFNAFRYTNLKSVKVVIVGQDPYHNPNQAHGLAFSVPTSYATLPPSLNNIYTELKSDIPHFTAPNHGCLYKWTQEGVLLLNSILTVESGVSCSHSNIGWEQFTDQVIHIINAHLNKIIFILWGRYAQNKGNIINHKRHYILTASHPSPISAQKGFFGCRHFSKTNILLQQNNKKPINWHLNI